MIKRSHIQCKPGSPGDNVAVPIPSVDRGRGDPRNILGVILYRGERDRYNIAVKSGIQKVYILVISLQNLQQEVKASLNATVKVSRNARPIDANAISYVTVQFQVSQ
ncbi:hypothetical protein LOD99_4004 [Oopsacas minuta]|uniref:Uncharacterized protein n=1 Tax=Oopsacas minuta TaxID=111878 RepID=A0AAV7JVS0_9METZ|nr:hypothetical protein LOD99_4004 [Oopsacas minuta]